MSKDEMLKNWELTVHYMDDDIREKVHSEIAPCTNEDFLSRYCELHYQTFATDFVIN